MTQFDLIKKGYARIHVESSGGPAKRPKVKSVMTRPCVYLYPQSSVKEAGTLLITRNIAGILIVKDDATRVTLGFVTRAEISKVILKS
ncbi:MAG: CBS domain-containing protein [Acidilobaceae archaeon]